jgi:hypothetical protein
MAAHFSEMVTLHPKISSSPHSLGFGFSFIWGFLDLIWN